MGSLNIKNKVLRCEKCFMLKKVTIEPNYPQTNVSCECSCGIKKESIVEFTKELQKEEQYKIKCNFCGKEPKYPSYCTGCRRTYCSTCIKSHDTKIETRSPHLVIDSYKYDFYCSKHQDDLVSAYCMGCNLNICQKCIDEKLHKSHRFVKYTKYLLEDRDLDLIKINIKVNFDKVDLNARKVDKLMPLLTDENKIKEIKEVCETSVRENKAILVLVKYFYKMYKHAKYRNYSMIFNIIENMKFNPLIVPAEDTNSIEKRRLDLLDFFKREFVIYRRFAASKRRSKTTVPNMRNVNKEGLPKDENEKINMKVAKIEDDIDDRNYTVLSKEFDLNQDEEKTENNDENTEKETNGNPNEENDKKDINNNPDKESTQNNDNKDEKNNQDKDNKEGNNGEAPNIKENENNEKKIENKDEEKKEDNKTKDNEDPNKKKENNFKVDDKIKNRIDFMLNKPEEEKKESKVIDIRKLCAMEIEEQKKNERKREKKEEKKEDKKEENKEVPKEPKRIRKISNKTIILHLTGLPIGMPAAPKTPEEIAREEEEERKRKEEEEKKREEELARKKVEDMDRQKRVKKALLRIKTKKTLQTVENKEPTPPPQPNISNNPKFSEMAKVVGNRILQGQPLLRNEGKEKDQVHEIIMNKPMTKNGSMQKKKPKKIGFSDDPNAIDEEDDVEEENKE